MKEELNSCQETDPNVDSNQQELIVEVDSPTEVSQEIKEQIEPNVIKELNKLLDICGDISSQIVESRHKDVLMHNLHNEMQQYKANMYRKLMIPIVMQIIQLSDNIKSITQFYPECPGDDVTADYYTKLRNEYNKLPDQINDMLACFFIEPFEGEPGRLFDPKKQSVGGILSGSNQDDDNIVTKSICSGYVMFDEKEEFLIRREKVEIYKLNNK